MRRAPRARGVFSRIRPTASAVDPEPHLLAPVRVERGAEPEDPPVGFPGGVAGRQGLGPARPVLTRPRDDDLRGGHGQR